MVHAGRYQAMNILTAIITGIDNAGVNAQEKGVTNDGEKITQFSNRREDVKGIQGSGMANTTQKVRKRRKEKQFGKASRTEQL
jgi:hypothetical protein